LLGEGSFGKVLLVEKTDKKKLFAMKVLRKQEIQKTNSQFSTQQERDILVKMKCPFIVKIHYAFQTPQKLYIVMDFMIGGEFYYLLKKSPLFNEEHTVFYSAQILLGIEALHQNLIIHRDLKPSNILIDQYGNIKLADFGLSKLGIKNNQKTHSLCGTPEYIAPEVLLDDGHDQMVDYWSLGAIIYEALIGKQPFYNKDKIKMLKDRILKKVEIEKPLSEQAIDIIQGLLNTNPNERLGKNGIQEIKQHPFYANIEWDKLNNREIQPPFKPIIQSKYDLKYFSKVIYYIFIQILLLFIISNSRDKKLRKLLQIIKQIKIQGIFLYLIIISIFIFFNINIIIYISFFISSDNQQSIKI
ncbi:protein kinase domain protein, partial [Ichthyophthirius multifiliis]